MASLNLQGATVSLTLGHDGGMVHLGQAAGTAALSLVVGQGPKGDPGPAGPAGSGATNADIATIVTTTGATKSALSATFAAFDPNTLPGSQGARGDYTGRRGTTGTGTDNRAAIQAALNAASNLAGTGGYYDYLTRKSVTVRLPSGHYLISAPSDGSPSLSIPAGVTLDASDATLYFDYPATATATWCGIKVGQYGNLQVGKLFPSGRVAVPDSAKVYDAIRLWQTDNSSRVIGLKDSEINGFQGAGIRGVGAWIPFVAGIRFIGNSYGYVASMYGDGTLGGSLSISSGTTRSHTDLRIHDCTFTNHTDAAILGAVSGKAGAINAIDFSNAGLTLDVQNCVFENTAARVVNIGNALEVSFLGCGFEEVGAPAAGMVILDSVQVATFLATRINLAGRVVPGPTGTAQPTAAYWLETPNVKQLIVDGVYIHNTLQANMKLASAAASRGWRINGVYFDSFDFGAGPMYVSESASYSGTFNHGHLAVGGRHLWVDSKGTLRHAGTAPTVETDGLAVMGPDAYAVGQATHADIDSVATGVGIAAGRLQLSYFTAAKTETVSNVRTFTTSTGAAGATPTLCRVGLYSVDPTTQDLTLVASTANNTALWSAVGNTYSTALTSSATLTAGKRYAVGVLCVTAAATPALWGTSSLNTAPNQFAVAPRRQGQVASQTDLPSTLTEAAMTNGSGRAYAYLF